MADKPKDHTKTIDTIKKTVGELKKNMNKVTKGHEKMAAEKESSPEDHKAALDHFASQYKMAMMNKEEGKAKEYAKSYHEYAAKLDKHYHSKLKESKDICPECMEEPCVCGGNHLGEQMNPYKDDEQIDEGASAAVRMQRALNKVQDARKRQERLAAPYVKSVMGKKEEKKKDVAEAKADPTSSWVVHDGDKVKRFKTHEGAKAHAQKHGGKVASSAHYADKIQGKQAVAEGLQQTLRKVVPGYAKREIDKKMDAGKFGKTDADKDANFQRYKKIQDKIKKQGVAEAAGTKPGWMLKQDPALAKKIADAKKLAKARKASYGDPSKGVSVNEAKSLSKMTVDELDKAHKENEAKIKAYTSNPTKALTKGHPLMTRRRSINLYKIIRAKQTNEEVEQVDELTNKALISYMSKVNDDIAKHKMDPSKRSAEKRNRSVSGFAKAYNKVQSNLKSVKEGSDYEKQIIAGYKAKYKPEDVKSEMEKTKKEYESHHGNIEKQGHEYSNYRGYHHGKDLMTKYNNLKSIHKMITSD